ncbi:MFS transporter [Rosenbergiella sp. S61]|uniref:MFS transporter n=1 Tax=Rosenbergiella gaditana TaxID=2726987 RepID=A0ABS5STB1_9GAMM|nr:MFS transporter [Rosenbergiella gaditana]MBT0723111.1 MFS transporter [Rosenbergiella gaditana]
MSYSSQRPNWPAVFAIAFCVACLITAEFLPVSLLTPMAADLHISEGAAGQTVTTTALVAMFASIIITSLIKNTDRRYVVIAFAILLSLSSLIVAFSTNFFLLLGGRVVLGIALGGFWALAASVTMKLVPPHALAKALSVVFGGVSIAMVIAAPIGSFLGNIIGWRNVFIGAAVLGGVCSVWLMKVLPAMRDSSVEKESMLGIFKQTGVMVAMLAIFLTFCGQFSFFTYIRPLLATVSELDVNQLTLIFLGFGIANFIGTSCSAIVLKKHLMRTLFLAPTTLFFCAGLFIIFGHIPWVASMIMVLWGLTFGFIPVAWSTWIARNLSHQAENAGAVQVAVIQFANTLGAALGGLLLDGQGILAPITLCGGLMLVTAGLIGFALPKHTATHQ